MDEGDSIRSETPKHSHPSSATKSRLGSPSSKQDVGFSPDKVNFMHFFIFILIISFIYLFRN